MLDNIVYHSLRNSMGHTCIKELLCDMECVTLATICVCVRERERVCVCRGGFQKPPPEFTLL